MLKGCISDLLSCCDTNPPSRNAACMLQLLPTASEFPSELPEGWDKFNAGHKSEKLTQKESVDRNRGCGLLEKGGDTSSGKSSSLSPLLTGPHIPRTEKPLWCLRYHGNFRQPLSTCGDHFPNPGSALPADSVSPQASHLQTSPAPSWPHCPVANAQPWTAHTDTISHQHRPSHLGTPSSSARAVGRCICAKMY